MSTPLFPYTWQYNNQTIDVLAANVNLLLPNENNYNLEGLFGAPWFLKPSMVKTSLEINDTYATTQPQPTFTGYKVVGALQFTGGNPYVEYLGTVESSNGLYSWINKGSVYVFGDQIVLNTHLVSAFTPGALVKDETTNNYVTADYMNILVDQTVPGEFDLYMIIASTATVNNIAIDFVSFEFEFMIPTNSIVNFIEP
jgi:hypothetical protein